jgi:hypothetical protein
LVELVDLRARAERKTAMDEDEWRTEVFHRYEAAFGESPPLMHWNERFDLFALMEMAIARGRKLTAEELGGGHPEDSAV